MLNRKLIKLQRDFWRANMELPPHSLLAIQLKPIDGQKIAKWHPALTRFSWFIKTAGPLILSISIICSGLACAYIILDSYFNISVFLLEMLDANLTTENVTKADLNEEDK